MDRETIENKKFRVVKKGYDPEQVDMFLSDLLRDLARAEKETEADKFELAKYREIEYTLTNTLITAQKNAQQLVEEAKANAQAVRTQAEVDAAALTADAQRKHDEMMQQAQDELDAFRREMDAEMGALRNKIYAMRDFETKYRASVQQTLEEQQALFDKRFASEVLWDESPVAAEAREAAQAPVDLEEIRATAPEEDQDLKKLIEELT